MEATGYTGNIACLYTDMCINLVISLIVSYNTFSEDQALAVSGLLSR